MIFKFSNFNRGAILLLLEDINDELKNHLSEKEQVVFSPKYQEMLDEK